MTELNLYVIAYLTTWWLLVSLAWLLPLPQRWDSRLLRFVICCVGGIIAFGIGVQLDQLTLFKPHTGYAQWEFYFIFVNVSLLLALPIFILKGHLKP